MTEAFDSYFNSILEAMTPFVGDNKIDAGRMADFKQGNYTETAFASLLQNNKVEFREANAIEETRFHIDFYAKLSAGREASFEVKPLSRGGFYTIELVGRSGMPGAVYGKADYMAFHNPVKQLFYIVDREKLKGLVEKVGGVSVDRWGNLSNDRFKTVDNIEEADLFEKTFYFRRNGRGGNDPSLLTTISVEKMREIKSFVLKLK
jgi:hypothetical protein